MLELNGVFHPDHLEQYCFHAEPRLRGPLERLVEFDRLFDQAEKVCFRI